MDLGNSNLRSVLTHQTGPIRTYQTGLMSIRPGTSYVVRNEPGDGMGHSASNVSVSRLLHVESMIKAENNSFPRMRNYTETTDIPILHALVYHR